MFVSYINTINVVLTSKMTLNSNQLWVRYRNSTYCFSDPR